MLPGPVFALELLTTARRRRYYLLRTAYAATILVFMAVLFNQTTRWVEDKQWSHQEVAAFGAATFGVVCYVEALAIVGLTPLLVAGVVADETQRKTLHFILTTRLSSSEIVLGKMFARMLHVTVFIAITIPIVSILGLIGGVDPSLQLAMIAGSASTGFFLASVSLLASTLARRVRDAVFVSYAFVGLWLGGPALLSWLILVLTGHAPTWMLGALVDAAGWLWAIGPFSVIWKVEAIFAGRPEEFFEALRWMCGLQVGFGVALSLLATHQLRPAFRRREARVPARAGRWGLPRLMRPRARSGCGDRPMLWKERRVRPRGAVRVVMLALGGGFLLLTAYSVGSLAWPAFFEFWSAGAGQSTYFGAVESLSPAIMGFGTAWALLLLLGLGGASAASVTSEVEGDTWISLLATPLTSAEILGGKALGALLGLLVPLAVVAVTLAVGLLCGAIHPVGIAAFAVQLVAYGTFASGLGTYVSLQSRSTWRAQAITQGTLLGLAFGIFCCIPVFYLTPWIIVISPVVSMPGSLVRPTDLSRVFGASDGMGAAIAVVSWVAYLVVGGLLWKAALLTLEERRGEGGPGFRGPGPAGASAPPSRSQEPDPA